MTSTFYNPIRSVQNEKYIEENLHKIHLLMPTIQYVEPIPFNCPPLMSALSTIGFKWGKIISAYLILTICAAEAGTWSSKQWTNEEDLLPPDLASVTHAIAFGVDSEPAAPEPFEITNKISGENWTVYRFPDHTTSVAVSSKPEHLVAKMPGNGSALIRGRILPKGKSGGIIFELSELVPGLKYNFVLFGLCLMALEPPGGLLVNASASDVPDQSEVLSAEWKDTRIFVYEYIAPPDGQITISLGNIEANQQIGKVRCCAFLNYRVD